ncbi:MAG: signal peptide peptidase SppA [Elusimicrobiaceae bacterium]|nr:signal peptide peptidase SppA [Elusimicrobiaceae bacterium]
MAENKNENLSDFDKTSTHLPTEQWEKKLQADESAGVSTDKPVTSHEGPLPPPHSTFTPRSVWGFLLLLVFLVSACCGLYLAVRPVAKCPKTAETPVQEGTAVLVSSLAKSSKPGLAWIKVRGVIAQDNNTSPFARPMGAAAIAKRIRQATEDKNVKAIVLDINSPGGTVASVQNIYGELLKAKQKGKKIVALFRDVAASGGFYIAMAADKIVAEPGTITGSVGVIMQTGNVEGLFEKIGVKMIPITSGKYKDIGSAYRPMTTAEKAILQDMVNDTYTQFFAAVKAGRPEVKEEDLLEYTDGRVFTGQRAYNLGFVDKLGGEEEARLLAGELAGLKDPKVLSQRGDGIREFIFSLGSSMESRTLVKELQALATPSVSYLWVH